MFSLLGEQGGFPRNPDYSKDSGNPDILTKYLGSTLPANCNVGRVCIDLNDSIMAAEREFQVYELV